MGLEDCAEGILAVAVQEMIRALRLVSVERGEDPREAALIAFGGAGPLHACAVADELGVRRVVAPPAAGVLAALGLVMAGERRDYVQTVLARVDAGDDLAGLLAPLAERAGAGAARGRRSAPAPTAATPARATPSRWIGTRTRPRPSSPGRSTPPTRPATATPSRAGRWRRSPCGSRPSGPGPTPSCRARRSGPPVPGPAVIPMDGRDLLGRRRLDGAAPTRSAGSSWSGGPTSAGRRRERPSARTASEDMDPVTLQVMANALRAVAEEMEAALIRSAFSPNIKERRDCSTAIFDADGRMVVQSASIPVHLGAMPEAVDAARARGAAPGEVWLVNDPYRGGTHLPDLTMISAVRPRRRGRRLRGDARPPRRRRRHGARAACPPARASSCRRGSSSRPSAWSPAARRRGTCSTSSSPTRARRASARATSAPSSPPTAWPSAGWPRWPPATAPGGCARPSARCWTTPSAAPGRRSPPCRTAATRRPRPSRATA